MAGDQLRRDRSCSARCSEYSTQVIQYKLAIEFRNFRFYIVGMGNPCKCHSIYVKMAVRSTRGFVG